MGAVWATAGAASRPSPSDNHTRIFPLLETMAGSRLTLCGRKERLKRPAERVPPGASIGLNDARLLGGFFGRTRAAAARLGRFAFVADADPERRRQQRRVEAFAI